MAELRVTFSQMAVEFPKVAAQLARLSGEELDEAVRRVVEAALTATNLQVPDRVPKQVERLVWSLDDAAWDLQDKAERGEVSRIVYNRAFLQARAANSLLELLEGRHGQAVYEAVQALNSDEAAVLRLLEGSPH